MKYLILLICSAKAYSVNFYFSNLLLAIFSYIMFKKMISSILLSLSIASERASSSKSSKNYTLSSCSWFQFL